MPVTVMVMALAQPAIGTIFEDKYVQAPLYLALLSVIYLFSAMGSLSTGNLINGQGYTKYNLKLNLFTVAIGFPLSFILVSQFGIIGLIVATTIVGIPSFILSLRFVKKKFDLSLDWGSSAKITLSSAAAGIITFFAVSVLPFSSPILLVLGAGVFVIVFVFLVVVTRTLNKVDLENIRGITNAMGPLRKPLSLLIRVIEKLMNILGRPEKKSLATV